MELKKLYYEMLRIRVIEERIAELYAEQQMRCPVHLCIGQEAVCVGVSAAIQKDDHVFGGHRSHGHYLAKGGNLPAFLAELYGKETGCSGGKGGSMHLIDLDVGFLGTAPIVASTLPIATGAAFGHQLRGEKCLTVAYFGEGATEEGAFHESINFALLKNLPIVYICENNLYSVYSHLEVRQPKTRKVHEIVKANGMTTFSGDGNDIEEVVKLTTEAAARTRSGKGPTFLEFSTYRWREHCGPNYDNDIGYRTVQEFENWKKLCPLTRLAKKANLSDAQIEAMTVEIREEFDKALEFVEQSAFPEKGRLMEHIYA